DKAEGDTGTTDFTFTVIRTGDTTGTSSVAYAVTGSGTNAADATDFGGTLPTGTVNFAANETSQTITIEVSGDTDAEPDEGFTVTLSNPVGATIDVATASGLIRNDDSDLPDVVYVDDSFAGTMLGDDPNPTDNIDMEFGVNAFDNVFDGVNGVASRGRIVLFNGNYREAVLVEKQVIVDLEDGGTVILNTTTMGTDTTLFMIGSEENDTVTFGPTVNLSQIVAKFNGVAATNKALPADANNRTSFNLTGRTAFAAALLGGNDKFQMNGADNIDVQVHAGTGNDYVFTGAGNDLVFGGDGNDTIVTNDGFDVLVGGMGSDQLSDGSKADVVVAGFVVNFTTEQFYQLRDDWADNQVVNTPGLASAFKAAVRNDNVIDILSNGQGADLFSFFVTGGFLGIFFDDSVSLSAEDVDVSTL
ncbi:MAG: Calx-beta domain-containing protein, partial [Gemmataceae bacterium]